MKLIGSRREQEMREELIRSNLALRDGSRKALVSALEKENVNVARAYVINVIPEQTEDIYAVLVSPNEVLILEVPRRKGQIRIGRQDLASYQANCSKVQRFRIAVAQDLFASRSSRFAH